MFNIKIKTSDKNIFWLIVSHIHIIYNIHYIFYSTGYNQCHAYTENLI
jgi:hypothetical protein